ncbi:MAG: mechanosensitive ion channel protein MscS [Acidobacteria bacterium]|nr:MAG: mechanosensitive ion channel protein MscS [Acidobacteriota bacterium]
MPAHFRPARDLSANARWPNLGFGRSEASAITPTMNFWHNLQMVAGVIPLLWLTLGFYLAALVLYFYVAAERPRLRTAAVLYALALIGFAIMALMQQGGIEQSISYPWLRWTAQFIKWVAIINVARVLLFNVLLPLVRIHPPKIVIDLLLAISYIVFGLSLLTQSGVNLNGILVTSTVITAAIAFSLQDTLGNVMGGLALQMERSVSVGDWIRIGADEGRVSEISWRQTSIETRNWDTIVIPNSVLMRSQVMLLGHRTAAPRQQRRWVYFNVDFRYAPSEVIAAVEAALRADPIEHVARAPAPHCLMVDFKDSYGYYAARYWLTDLALTDPTDSVVRHRVYFALKRAGIPLSIPAQMLFVEADDPKRRERKRSEELMRRDEALRSCELFSALTDDERTELATNLNVAPFIRGEVVTRQGAVAHWLYILRRGEAEVRVRADGSDLSEHVATLREGDFFGEMGLLTGEPRTATIIALTDVDCYRLDKQHFNEVLQRRPEVAQDLAHILARRRVELDAVLEGLNEEAKRQRISHLRTDFLGRIRHFFTLDRYGKRNGG